MEIHNRRSLVRSSMAKKTINSKRLPLADLTNRQSMASCEEGKIPKMKNRFSCSDASIAKSTIPESTYVKSSVVKSSKDVHVPQSDGAIVSTITAAPIKSCEVVSPSQSNGGSVSSDESMYICDSSESLEFEYIDDCDDSAVTFIEKKTRDSLTISDDVEIAGDIYKDDSLVKAKINVEVVNIDDNSAESTDPQFSATIESEIYDNLRASETKKWPSVDYMERIQSDINASMRSVLIDWLVEVAEEYILLPETLFLAVNYLDRYLSGNDINRERLQLLGVACMLIASKYEEICAPQVKDLSYITDCTYSRDEVLQMESDVLNYLKFEMSAVTARCFLWRFVRAAQEVDEVPSMQLECLASYLSELSLLEYKMICYSPSLIAASATFLAKFILKPSVKPWTVKLKNYTLYGPADLRDCVKALHCLFRNSNSSGLPAIRDKYSVHKYKFVAKKYCPLYIPPEYFV